MNGLRRLVHEIHRRSLWQVLAIYLAGSWFAYEIVQGLTEGLGLPEWFPALAVVLLIVGLPVVIATAFVQEGGPIGDDQEMAAGSSAGVASSRIFSWRNAILGGVGAFTLLGVVGAGWVLLGGETAEPEGRGGAAALVEQSVAVIPFENVSADPENEYFSDGITDELLNALAQIPGLRVPGRTSSFAFKGQEVPIQLIADTLDVTHVVTGSVRRAGDRVRIGAQLVDAGADRQIWAESYDRQLSPTEVFAIQEEIAQAIVDRLQVQLGGEEIRLGEGTESQDAYDLYLRARASIADRRTLQGVDSALTLYERAIEADPGYALAHAGAAEAWAVRPNYGGDAAVDLERAERAARRAISLDPSSGRGRLVLASLHRDRWDWETAAEHYQVAVARLGNDPEAHHDYGQYLLYLGDCEAAASEQRRALTVDPLSPVYNAYLSWALTCLGRLDEAVPVARRAHDLGLGTATRLSGFILLEAGEFDEAGRLARSRDLPELAAIVESVRDGRSLSIPSNLPGNPVFRPWALALAGDAEGALEGLRAYQERGLGTTAVFWMPSVQRLLGDDPRFQALLEEIGIDG